MATRTQMPRPVGQCPASAPRPSGIAQRNESPEKSAVRTQSCTIQAQSRKQFPSRMAGLIADDRTQFGMKPRRGRTHDFVARAACHSEPCHQLAWPGLASENP